MKNCKIKKSLVLIWICNIISISTCKLIAQTTTSKELLAVVAFDANGYPNYLTNAIPFINNELTRIGQFNIIDKYDLDYIAKRDSLKPNECFSRICLQKIGKSLGVKKIMTGGITNISNKIQINFRIYNSETNLIEKNYQKEFLQLDGQEYNMIKITLNEMFGIPNEEDFVNKLTKSNDLDGSANNPFKRKLSADGCRIGAVILTGENATIMSAPRGKGGFAGQPYMFQFGYQFEKQYLNEGNFQALFEFLPMVSGLDQGRFIPSITFMNGLRNNKSGWEFAFGPTFSLANVANGYYDSTGNWQLKSQLPTWRNPSNFNFENRLDSRGDYQLQTGFVFAVGKTFKSGKLNLPINFFFVPNNNGARFGLSVGWNAKERTY